VSPGDPVALADAIDTFLANPAMAGAFSRAGRARGEAHFGERAMLERVETLLDRLIEKQLGLVFSPGSGWSSGSPE
jgi:glycosyltransferase involved in cell wall biosynthesis